MILYKQEICDKDKGDCLRACIATVLQIPIKLLPNFHSNHFFIDWMNLLDKFGIEIRYSQSCWIQGYWIASVPSKNFKTKIISASDLWQGKTGVKHSIVMKGQEVFFDPSPKKKYKVGENLLIQSKFKVEGGYTFIISDIEKTSNLFTATN